MKRALRVLPDAEAELVSAAIWYEDKHPGLGVEFVAIVVEPYASRVTPPEPGFALRLKRVQPFVDLGVAGFDAVVLLEPVILVDNLQRRVLEAV